VFTSKLGARRGQDVRYVSDIGTPLYSAGRKEGRFGENGFDRSLRAASITLPQRKKEKRKTFHSLFKNISKEVCVQHSRMIEIVILGNVKLRKFYYGLLIRYWKE
jgi:hypothetical protein